MNTFSQLMRKRKKKRAKNIFNKGYDYGAGIILRNDLDELLNLRAHISASLEFNTLNSFDDGIQQAFRDAKRLDIDTEYFHYSK